jgi:hypothetical protein
MDKDHLQRLFTHSQHAESFERLLAPGAAFGIAIDHA